MAAANWRACFRKAADPARLHGIDLVPERVKANAALPQLDVRLADARTFSLGPDSLDLVWLQTVFSSIRDDDSIIAIVDRVREMLRSGGGVLWYDFFLPNPRNPYTRPMRRRDIERYFGEFEIELTRVTVLPRWPAASACSPIRSIRCCAGILCSHYLGVFKV